jgi:hypothetical protein
VNETERDREIDAAWDAASREEPPPALDAAIRAEARRAVGAAPGGRRHKHWWYPLAAAATVAVLAIGIVQLTPPEQVAPSIVAEQSVAPREATNEPARQPASTDARVAAPPVTAPAAAPPPVQAQSTQKRDQGAARGAIERERVPAPAQAPLAKKQLAEPNEEVLARDKLAQAPASRADAAATTAATAGGAAAPDHAAAPRSEPFPAKTATPGARRETTYAEEAQKPAANAAGGAPAAPAPSPAAGSMQVESRVAAAKVANVDEAKAKDAGARSVEDWIKRIRELKNEGRIDEAAKELTAFRAAFGERADALLPADLRALKMPPTK